MYNMLTRPVTRNAYRQPHRTLHLLVLRLRMAHEIDALVCRVVCVPAGDVYRLRHCSRQGVWSRVKIVDVWGLAQVRQSRSMLIWFEVCAGYDARDCRVVVDLLLLLGEFYCRRLWL